MTLFLTDSVSVRNTVNIFEEFYRYAGLNLNKTKIVVFLFNPKHVHLKYESLGIKYTDKPFKSLGIWFSSDPAESALLNTTAKINIIKNIIKSWQPRCLSLKGKITVIKIPDDTASVATIFSNHYK